MVARRLAAALLVAMLGSTSAAQAQGWTPPVELADPGPDGKRISEAGLLANFLPAPGKGRKPAVLLIGGSEGGLGSGALRMGRGLQEAGFAVLQVSYYRAPGQPEAFSRIPLETFDKALAWLRRRGDVDAARIAIVGASKGAEAALIVASRDRRLRAVVAGMPSNVVWPAFSWDGSDVPGSSWTLGGKDLPALPYGNFDPARGMASVYASGLGALADYPQTRIPIERSRAAVLLVCGQQDALWPACPMAEAIRQRDRRVRVLAYEDAGHAVFGVPLADDDRSLPALAGLGGSPQGNNAARKDGWPKVIDFLRSALRR